MPLEGVYTGRLKRCSRLECGRVEDQEGEFKRCARCRQVSWCARLVCQADEQAARQPGSQAGGLSQQMICSAVLYKPPSDIPPCRMT